MNSLVSIIIVNWNGLRWLPDCFASLYAQQYKNFEIIFVDNASKDSSVLWVKQHYPATKIITNRKNLGFAQGNNVGYRQAMGNYVLFLNNDTRMTKTFLTELIRVLDSDPKIGGAQSKIRLMDHPDTLDSIGAYLTPTGFLYHYAFGQKDAPKYNKQIDLYTAKGACMMFKKSVLDKIMIQGDIFDPDYFAYFEESDMCHRIWLVGYRIVYAYKSVIYHKMGATSIGMNGTFIQYHSFKNRIRTYMKNLSLFDACAIIPLHIGIVELYGIYLLIKGKIDIWFSLQRAIGWNIRHITKTLTIRKIIHTRIYVYTPYMRAKIFRFPPIKYYYALVTDLSTYNENE